MKGFVLIYAVFHPTIKIMDDDIDLAWAVAMTGLRLLGFVKKEFSSLSFSNTVRKPFSWCVHTCVSVFVSVHEVSVYLSLCARVLDHPLF